MMTRHEWETRKRRMLTAIDIETEAAEAELRLIEDQINNNANQWRRHWLTHKQERAKKHLEYLRKSRESVERETFEEAKGDAAYDAWKSRRDDAMTEDNQ